MAKIFKLFKTTTQNAKYFKINERRDGEMLQALLDFILYIPRRINRHFERYRNLEEENKRLKEDVRNRKNLSKRIIAECEYYMKQNQSVSHTGFSKIKRIANTFPNDTANSL